ncbi:MAG TPA: cytochrome P450, partial [Myxococcales bacterium]|nr:cytochrome P450 [Myxococcales bacterium]
MLAKAATAEVQERELSRGKMARHARCTTGGMLQPQTQPRPHTQLASAPRHHGHLISGSLPELREDPLALLARVARENGDVARVRLMMDVHFINHPALVMRVMRENHQNYRKGALYDRLQGMLGDGLFTLEGEFWKKRRRLVQPAFHRQRIAALEEPVARRTDALIERWSRAAAGGTPVDVHADMTQLTLAVAGDALFGSDLLGEASEVGRAMAELLEVLDRRVSSIWVAPEWMPTPDNLRARAGKAVMDRVVRRVIEQRRSGPPRADLLGMLMEMKDADTGEGMTD